MNQYYHLVMSILRQCALETEIYVAWDYYIRIPNTRIGEAAIRPQLCLNTYKDRKSVLGIPESIEKATTSFCAEWVGDTLASWNLPRDRRHIDLFCILHEIGHYYDNRLRYGSNFELLCKEGHANRRAYRKYVDINYSGRACKEAYNYYMTSLLGERNANWWVRDNIHRFTYLLQEKCYA